MGAAKKGKREQAGVLRALKHLQRRLCKHARTRLPPHTGAAPPPPRTRKQTRQTAGMPWMRVVVAIGALLGIITGVLVGVMAVARIFSAVGRAHLVFPVVGHVHKRCALLGLLS